MDKHHEQQNYLIPNFPKSPVSKYKLPLLICVLIIPRKSLYFHKNVESKTPQNKRRKKELALPPAIICKDDKGRLLEKSKKKKTHEANKNSLKTSPSRKLTKFY